MAREIKLYINNFQDRQNIVVALANAGYKVTVEEGKEYLPSNKTYWVIFEIND